MFEFSTARKYLWPKKRQLSVSLIGLLSIFVISVVVWLLLLFLSITEGIEKGWLNRLTALNGAIRITPTEEYYSSYYYQIDSISGLSHYTHKNIKEKLLASSADPHSEEDEEIPFYWPLPVKTARGELLDLVKGAFCAIDQVKQQGFSLSANDSEVVGALLRLRLIRPEAFAGRISDGQSFLTQASYFSSFPENTQKYLSLIDPPSIKDLNHLLYIEDESFEASESADRPTLMPGIKKKKSSLAAILSNIEIQTVEAAREIWRFTPSFLPKNASFIAFGDKRHGGPSYLVLPVDKSDIETSTLSKGILSFDGTDWSFTTDDRNTFAIDTDLPLFLSDNLLFSISFDSSQIENIETLRDLTVFLSSTLQGHPIQGTSLWQGLYIAQGKAITHFEEDPIIAPPWVYSLKNQSIVLPENGIILPKNYRENHVLLGDRGYISYTAATFTGVQELRTAINVCGFYDPGVMAIGSRIILCSGDLVHTINSSSETISLDPMMGNGIQVWLEDLKETQKVASLLEKEFSHAGLSPYWKITPFYEYGFAKDLMAQFQSDRYLFMIVGIIILFVACCNIISLLLLLVNDKKQEIGILLSLGAKKSQIALIFGLCGIFLGITASLAGTLAAYCTLSHIDSLVHLLNMLEGQEAFNAAFYGSSLPKELSRNAAIFIAIATPILSTLSGLIPAIKACRLKPSAILRSE